MVGIIKLSLSFNMSDEHTMDVKLEIALERLSVKVEFLSSDIQKLINQQENTVKKEDFAKLEKKVDALQAEKGHWFDRVAAAIIAAIVGAIASIIALFIQK